FLIHAFRAAWQAKAAPTSIAASLLRDANRAFWTRTLWNEEAAMRSFMLSGPHRRVMPRIFELWDAASVVNWVQESAEAPPWREAHRRMQQEGRRSKGNHPSERQLRFELPEPRMGAGLKFK